MHSHGMLGASIVKRVAAVTRTVGCPDAPPSETVRYADPSSRGDVIRWLDGADGAFPATSALTQWLRGELLNAVRDACAAVPAGSNPAAGAAPALHLEPAHSLPLGMLACYPGGGARFKRHVDNSPEAPDGRAVTAILYLNSRWTHTDGGTLRIYPTAHGGRAQASDAREKPIEVEPRSGTLVLFWSHRVPHEVAESFAPRFALSLWMCVDPHKQAAGWLERREHLHGI